MQHINKIILSLLFVATTAAILSVLPAIPAHAETRTVSLTATPAVLDVGGEAGGEAKVSFQLTNGSKEAVLPIHMTTRDSQARDGQTPELVRSLSAKSWIRFAEPNFILEANQTKVVEVILQIPEDAPSGGHYADIVVQPLSLESDDGIIAAQPELAVQLLASVAGNIREELSVRLHGPSSVITNRNAEMDLAFTVYNQGNIHTLFRPEVYLQKGEGNSTAIQTQPVIILPGENKELSFKVPNKLSPGMYAAQARFNYGTPSKQAKSIEMRLIVFPFSPTWLLIIPLIGVAAYGYRIRHRLISAVRIIAKGDYPHKKTR